LDWPEKKEKEKERIIIYFAQVSLEQQFYWQWIDLKPAARDAPSKSGAAQGRWQSGVVPTTGIIGARFTARSRRLEFKLTRFHF
jgi:hypothetical protein